MSGQAKKFWMQNKRKGAIIKQAAIAIVAAHYRGKAMIRDEVTIKDKGSCWHVSGFKHTEDKTFTDRDQAAAYAVGLGKRHFVPVVWLPATMEELTSGR